jgi:hypothetical protein
MALNAASYQRQTTLLPTIASFCFDFMPIATKLHAEFRKHNMTYSITDFIISGNCNPQI